MLEEIAALSFQHAAVPAQGAFQVRQFHAVSSTNSRTALKGLAAIERLDAARRSR